MDDAIEEKNDNSDTETVIKKEKGLMRESGQSFKNTGLSDVINISPGINPRTFLHTSGNDVTIEIDGKLRLDSSYGSNTQYLNKENNYLDQFYIPGRSTFDLGLGISYGQNKYDREVVEIGIDLRNKSIFGKPDEVATTSKNMIKDGDYSFGNHNHWSRRFFFFHF